MEEGIKKVCDLVIKNYNKLKEELRFDGEFINHFGSLIYADDTEIPIGKIKKIRTAIKNKTSRMSYFRGDILYMISFLIGKQKNVDEYIDDMIDTYEEMKEAKFEESADLVLSSYAIVKHSNKEKRTEIISNMMEIYKEMKKNYRDITNSEDYLECALLALNGIDKEKSVNYMESRFNSVVKLNLFSKNSIQGLTLALMLNHNNPEFNSIQELLNEFETQNIKISHQVLALLGIAAGTEDSKEYATKIKSVIEYLSSEESEYQFYMDRSFRAFIAIALVEVSKKEGREEYISELMLMVVNLFIKSKNQGLVAEVLA